MNIGEKYYCSSCLRTLEDEHVICPYCGYDPSSETAPSVLEENVLLNNGRYLVGAVLGTGGFGITYAGWDLVMDGPVAIKEFFPSSICDRDIRQDYRVIVHEDNRQIFNIGLLRFNREARILVSLQNIKNVVSAYDWFEENNTAYIIMEFVRGVPLDEYVRIHNLTSAEVLDLLRDLIDSLVLIHKAGVYHRDISPNNILVQEDGTVTLIDFGAAIIEERIAQGKDRTVIYKTHFAPIEQFDGDERQGPWTDVYALSATLYYILSGDYPQISRLRKNKDNLHDIQAKNGRLTKWQKKAIMDGLIVSPDKRVQNMDIFRSILYHLPMPEEVRQRRAFMAKVRAVFAALFIILTVLLLNFTVGLPLGRNMLYSFRNDGVHITKYYGKDPNIKIPQKKAGITVSSIDRDAFSSSHLVSAQIPGSIKTVGMNSFSGCEKLERVIIEEGSERLESLAFSGCPLLNTVILPGSLSFIGENVFSECSGSLTVWCDINSVCREPLLQENINTTSESSYITREAGNGIEINGYVEEFSQDNIPDTIIVPDYVNGVPVTSMSMLESDEKSNMFENVYKSIELPDHITVLPKGIVNNLYHLDELRLGSELETLGENALSYCGIQSIDLPESLTKIGEGAFSGSFLTSLTLPDSVSDVGDSAFATMTQLESIFLSSEMTEIPDGAFEGCTALASVAFRDNSKIERIGMFGFSKCRSLEALKLPSGIKKIDRSAFSDCVNLKIIDIPPTVSEIDQSVFDGCPNDLVIAGSSGSRAESFAVENNYQFLDLSQYDYYNNRVTENEGLLIWDKTTEKEITYLPSVYSGSYYTVVKRLVDAKNLKSHIVYLPTCLEYIGYNSFAGNRYLTEVYGYGKIKEIETLAFWDCKNLNKVSIPSTINSIGKYAFAKDASLHDFYLPDSMLFIGDYAFWKSGIKSINIPPHITQLYDGCFAESDLSNLVIPGNVVKCRTAFYGCNKLANVTIEEGTRTLLGTFAYCRHLETVRVPASMERISRSTFKGCRSLKDIWIYSDNLDLDFTWPGVQYIKSMTVNENGYQALSIEKLEDIHSIGFLFSDCPNVTIHAHAGSTAQIFAEQHGLAFESIE